MSKSEGQGNGRTADGRFTKGNGGGPGNPFARQVAALRSAAVEELSTEEIKKLIRTLYEMALKGDRVAARLVLSYTLGKPQARQPDPDRLNADELAAFREEQHTTTGAMLMNGVDLAADEWLARVRRQWDRGEDPPPDEYASYRPKKPLGDGGKGRPTPRDGGGTGPRTPVNPVEALLGLPEETRRLISEKLRKPDDTDRA